MGLDRCLKSDDAGWASDDVMEKSKSEKCGKKGSCDHSDWILHQEQERSEQGEKAPEGSEGDPA